MKNKLLAAACAVSVLASVAALAAARADRARAAEIPVDGPGNMLLIGRNKDTDVFLVQHGKIACFVASTRAGSGISINCQH